MNYYKPNITKEWLENNKFKRYYKDNGDICFMRRFPVYTSGSIVSLECKLSAWFPSGRVAYSIEDSSSKGLYAVYYNREYGDHEDIVKKVDKAVMREFDRLGIKEVNNNEQM